LAAARSVGDRTQKAGWMSQGGETDAVICKILSTLSAK
jgi:hypothetical protein